MKHARPDYDRIQDPLGKIGADEPVFLLRAQDVSAPEVLRYWADENVRNDGDLELSELAEGWANTMEEWQRANTCKPADMPSQDARASQAPAPSPLPVAVPAGFQRIETVKYWANAFADDVSRAEGRIAGAMIIKLLNEYVQLRAMIAAAPPAPSPAASKREMELEAARFAYASEFPLNVDGEPDVGNIHANIRKLKAELASQSASAKDAARYQWLKENVSNGSMGVPGGWIDADTSVWDENIDGELARAAMTKEAHACLIAAIEKATGVTP